MLELTGHDAARFSVRFPYSKAFVAFLQGLPADARAFDRRRRCWYVSYRYLYEILDEGPRHFTSLDVSGLDPTWRERAATHLDHERGRRAPRGHAAFDVLHVVPGAPMAVVHAAYRALARMHHPDVGGRTEDMARLNRAYEQILLLLGADG